MKSEPLLKQLQLNVGHVHARRFGMYTPDLGHLHEWLDPENYVCESKRDPVPAWRSGRALRDLLSVL